MANSADDFDQDLLPTSEFLKLLKIEIPRIDLNKMYALRGLSRANIEKILYTVPASEVKINVRYGWDGEEELLLGLLAGRYIKTLSIRGCTKIIPAIPPSVNEVNIQVEKGYDCPAINSIAGAENIRKITLVNGEVDGSTWHLIRNRSTKLNLRLVNTKIINLVCAKHIMEKIDQLELKNAKWEGEIITKEEFETKIRNFTI